MDQGAGAATRRSLTHMHRPCSPAQLSSPRYSQEYSEGGTAVGAYTPLSFAAMVSRFSARLSGWSKRSSIRMSSWSKRSSDGTDESDARPSDSHDDPLKAVAEQAEEEHSRSSVTESAEEALLNCEAPEPRPVGRSTSRCYQPVSSMLSQQELDQLKRSRDRLWSRLSHRTASGWPTRGEGRAARDGCGWLCTRRREQPPVNRDAAVR